MEKINVLILGVGGDVSQGIIKALNQAELNLNIIGACVDSQSSGFYFCDKAYLSPFASSGDFIPWLIKICNYEKINIVMSGVEQIILKISENIELLKASTESAFVPAPIEKLLIGQNKLHTCQWLKENGLNYPEYASSSDDKELDILVKKVGFPLIAKPLFGKGSVGVIRINNAHELNNIKHRIDYVIQEYIGNDDNEYTVACYTDRDGKTYEPIIMRRRLKHGQTFIAEILENKDIRDEAISICKKFRVTGPLNIQLRLDKWNKPVCFEINVRFSGTLPIRSHFGFNDAKAMIMEYVLNYKIDNEFSIRKGLAHRYIDEIYYEEGKIFKQSETHNSLKFRNHNFKISNLQY